MAVKHQTISCKVDARHLQQYEICLLSNLELELSRCGVVRVKMNLKHPSVDQATCTMQYRASKLDPIPANLTLQWLTLSPVLMLEMDIRTTELDEYLEEFGYDGDEETVGVWDRILGATRSNSANGNGERTGADINSAEGADSIPAADRREFPGDNEPDFPQEKHLSGIRARKTTWHLLLVVPRELKVGSRSATLLPAEASTDKTELRKHIGCKVPRADQPNMKEAVDL
ncbi:hypothetical protein PC129_g17566 [Phytophthora cactorum]|uniref:Uncharacterized protein n=1 Tax=Phytophthora cactorum TaxID=29920 RepID=A0A8T1HJG7_9STRA|nr:hypothetical protein Pcac1_g20300 [Phytophthora cactorum]KAG2883516.1 hypothetical protein PC114_g20561 [Phytophthora cactorum]KAG2967505.1 hypothetical protein PC118_g18540 [Phytophthora cactorum]KAG2985493.1 hypothetical protein PC119_g20140 [Phytophthora cactorum]KAG3063931.1 hypothetical protein PC122_g18709 [Phytophthora cactorum]